MDLLFFRIKWEVPIRTTLVLFWLSYEALRRYARFIGGWVASTNPWMQPGICLFRCSISGCEKLQFSLAFTNMEQNPGISCSQERQQKANWFDAEGQNNVFYRWVPLYPNMHKSKLAFIRSIFKTRSQSLLCYSTCLIRNFLNSKEFYLHCSFELSGRYLYFVLELGLHLHMWKNPRFDPR